jgi:hypothetical protein
MGRTRRETLLELLNLKRDPLLDSPVDDECDVLGDVLDVDCDGLAVELEFNVMAREGEVESEVFERRAVDLDLGDC